MERIQHIPPQSVEQAGEPKPSGKMVGVEYQKLGWLLTGSDFAA